MALNVRDDEQSKTFERNDGLISQAANKRGLHLLILAGLGFLLVWLIVTHSFAAYFAQSAPELALSLNSSQPTALMKLVKARLIVHLEAETGDQDESAEDVEAGRLSEFATNARLAESGTTEPSDAEPTVRAEIRSLAERTLAADPLSAGALYALGEVAAAEGKAEDAAALMRASISRSFRETGAVYRMLLRSFEARNFPQALDHADAILRTSPRLTPHVVPLLARIAEDESARPLLEQRLAADPPWRRAFLSALPGAVTDARTPFNVLLALRDTPSPPTTADLRSYLSFLIRKKFHELAYYVWLQFLTPDDLASTGLIFNGRFERSLSGLPFDWNIRRGTGVTIQVSPAAGLERGRALQIEFGHGRIEFGSVGQMTLLAPGAYRFTGRFRGELAGRRGLVWRVSCAGQRNKVLGSSEMLKGLAPAWRTFAFTFEVPNDRSCRAQNISLTLDARSASERFVSGAVWYGNLDIERIGGDG